MSNASAPGPYTLSSLQRMLGLSKATVMSLVAEGFVSPQRGQRNEHRFGFQDVVLLRTAHELRQAKIGHRRVVASLRRLKESLPDELPLSGLRLSAVGSEVAVQEGGQNRSAETGQLLFDFDIAESEGQVAFLRREASRPHTQATTAADLWARGSELEAKDPRAAESAYREALRLDPHFGDAALNLGAMLCELNRPAEAVAVFDEVIKQGVGIGSVHFNRAIALEDLGREEEAILSYTACLKMDSAMADAHFNVARLHEKLGDPKKALRHYSAYRKLSSALV